MAILFTNKTTARTGSNKSDFEIMQENNALAREKKKLRYTVTFAVGIPLFIIIYFFLVPRLFHNYGVMLVVAAISLVIGYIPSEFAVKSKYGVGEGTGMVLTAATTCTYNFTEDKIMLAQDFDTLDIPYTAIERVTQDPYFFYIYYMSRKFQLDKNGFSTKSGDFERLMYDHGKNIGVECK